jgi:hypothetical protein
LAGITTNLKQQSMSKVILWRIQIIFYLSKDASHFIQGLNKPVKVRTLLIASSSLLLNHSASKMDLPKSVGVD